MNTSPFLNPSLFKHLIPLPWEKLPQAECQVSLIIPVRNCPETLEETVREAHQYLSTRFLKSFELLLIPNPAPKDDPSIEVCENLARKFTEVRVFPYLAQDFGQISGKGAAIRHGFFNSRGKWIFFTDADLPYDLTFFDHAAQKLSSGFDFITGNRRLPLSHFNIPVGLLPLAYGRHRLGLWFNRMVRLFLPIQTTDTQAGIKALSRRLAFATFSRQVCPGFLFDLEIFLTAQGHGWGHVELPVTLHLNSEKSTVRIFREVIQVGYWIAQLSWRSLLKEYGRPKSQFKNILSRYRTAPFKTRLFLFLRWWLTPYRTMAQRLPYEGKVLDLGCGHGLFSMAAAMGSSVREVHGVDHDSKRVELGSLATRNFSNIQLRQGDITHPSIDHQSYSAVALIDVMHYFNPQAQEHLIKQAFQLLKQGGTLLIREVDPEAGMIAKWNRLYEKWATRIGFTQSKSLDLHFRSPQGWEEVIEKHGFKVNSERCSSFLFADILYVCERK